MWREAKKQLTKPVHKLRHRFVHVGDVRWKALVRLDPREAWARWKDLTGQTPPAVDLPQQDVFTHDEGLGAPERKAPEREDDNPILLVFASRIAAFA